MQDNEINRAIGRVDDGHRHRTGLHAVAAVIPACFQWVITAEIRLNSAVCLTALDSTNPRVLNFFCLPEPSADLSRLLRRLTPAKITIQQHYCFVDHARIDPTVT